MPEQNEKITKAWNFLNELKQIDMLIDHVDLDYTETYMRAMPKGKSYSATGSIKSHNASSEVEEISTSLWQLSKEKEELIGKYARHKAAFYKIANRMHTTEYIDILVRYFSQGQKMEEIAENMNYSRAWIYEARRKAVAEFSEYMEVQDGIYTS